MSTFDELRFIADCAYNAELYDEAFEAIEKISKLGISLSSNDRTLGSHVASIATSDGRCSLRALQWKEEKFRDQKYSASFTKLITKIKEELLDKYQRCIDMCDRFIIIATNVDDFEGLAFYYQTKANYLKHIDLIYSSEDLQIQCENCYQLGMEIANNHLPPFCALKFTIILQYSVFCYETLRQTQRAIEITEKTVSDALNYIEDADLSLDVPEYSHASNIVALLRDNLNMWKEHLLEEI